MRKKEAKINSVLVLNKPLGKTPLDVIKDLKKDEPELEGQKIGYAGRLDPMAEGLLLLLVGEENKNKKKYEDLQKVYKIEILLGFSTDTYDILGKLVSIKHDYVFPSMVSIRRVLKSFEKKFDQEYPPYSSKSVNGKPLYYYARKNLLSEIKMPSKKVEIFEIFNISRKEIKGSSLLNLIEKRIALVGGDFRQEEILRGWQKVLRGLKSKSFCVVCPSVKCSSGTYMRSLAYNFGKKIDIPSLALSIKRTSIGDYRI